jgi:hypothetical protein
MSKLIAVSAALLLCLSLSAAQDQTPNPHGNTEAAQNRASGVTQDAATREDLNKMKALVQQMQTNLAFVTSTQGPLKHQFELEIEMWQLEIARLERRLGPEPKRE